MEYTELQLYTINEITRDILVSELSDIGFESFVNEQDCLKAYIKITNFDESSLKSLLESNEYFEFDKPYQLSTIPYTNWNEVWEKEFEPIDVKGHLFIHAPFHKPSENHAINILIKPRMSFGTGHHATTRLMCEAIMDIAIADKIVLDMGAGTGVLAILAMKLGASSADAVDNELTAAENCHENALLNQVDIKAIHGESNSWHSDGKSYDVIFANINRNIIQRDLHEYLKMLHQNGHILLSGFLTTDEKNILQTANHLNLQLVRKKSEDEWLMLHFMKL